MSDPSKEEIESMWLARLGEFLVADPYGGRGWSWERGNAPDGYHVQLHRFSQGGGTSVRGIGATLAEAIERALELARK